MLIMDHPSLQPYVNKYRDRSGVMNLGGFLRDAEILDVKTDCFPHNGKKLTKLIFPNQMQFYVKPVTREGAAHERVSAELYKRAGIIVPDTTIAALDDDYYLVTNDVFDSKNTVPGELFLQKITPGGAQYALPRVFGADKIDEQVMAYFTQKTLVQIAKHYGLALATRNWDANIGGLGFTLQRGKQRANGLIAFDFEKSLEPESVFGYANPFCTRRLSANKLVNCFKNSDKPFVKKDEIVRTIVDGIEQVDEIARESADAGFVPSREYLENLKVAMYDTAEKLEL